MEILKEIIKMIEDSDVVLTVDDELVLDTVFKNPNAANRFLALMELLDEDFHELVISYQMRVSPYTEFKHVNPESMMNN